MRLALVLGAVAAAIAVAAAPARADGDPASDYLVGTNVFFPFDAKYPAQDQARFAALVGNANRKGFRIRVALIAGSYDMGSITPLWRKPQTYSKFLGEELSFIYKQRVLVVMPNGYGISWKGHPTTAEQRVLATLPPPGGKANLLAGATKAVQSLAAASGVQVAAPAHVTTPGQKNSHDRLLIVAAVAVALLLAAVARFALRRRA